MNLRSRGFSFAEGIILFASVAIVTYVGTTTHRWMLAQTELLKYRSTMENLTSMVRAMPSKAHARRKTFKLHIDHSRGVFRLTSVSAKSAQYETVEGTLWLPEGLKVSESPDVLTVGPTGKFSPESILILAPSFNKLFRVTTTELGLVQLDEESAL